jgi:hypothetical protein
MRSARARSENVPPFGRGICSRPEHSGCGGEPLEARPPRGVKLRVSVLDRPEGVLAALDQIGIGVGRQRIRVVGRKAAEDVVDHRAPLSHARQGGNGIERIEF